MIPALHNFTAEQYTTTFHTHVVTTIGYAYCIVLDQETFFILSHFKSWTARRGIKWEPSTRYHPETDSQSEIVNEEIKQVAKACKREGNRWLSKILEIQHGLNLHYNASGRHNHFITILVFDGKAGLDTFPYPINKDQTATERNNATSQSLTNAKAG